MSNKGLYNIIPITLPNLNSGSNLDRSAIAYFAAAGFFFENDTYWQDSKWNELNFEQQPWRYVPSDMTMSEAVDAFANLFHTIVAEQTSNKKAILPLSGGLDSRTLAVAMQVLGKEPYTYSYRFEGSFEETKYGKAIAKALNWDFDELVIPPGYLWSHIKEAGLINGCYAEFTHARQVAVAEMLAQKGDVWLLGHWGDVLFDDMGIDSDLTFNNQVSTLYKKVLKKGGKELAADLWNAWGLDGKFDEQLRQRLEKMHGRIDITDANARIRAFKSLYWATRWTSTNLNYFSNFKPIALPYYDDRMCKFIMSIPEKYLAGRQIQIEYIKKYSPKLAAVAWQDKAPYNLFNYHKHLTSSHLPYRVLNKAKWIAKDKLLGKKLIQRNWEIQFLGAENDSHLRKWLFENDSFERMVPRQITEKYYNLFQTGDKVYWSHPLSILLTLSVFAKQNNL